MSLEWTGERFLPEVGAEISFEHRVRYSFAKNFIFGKKVLDVPSGEGYGSFELSENASFVVGVDISKEAVEHASQKYRKDNLIFFESGMENLSRFQDHEFDVLTCFEGIEHVDRELQKKALLEFRRVLKPDGVLFISSPNKRIYSDLPNFQNPYHFAEYYYEEMRSDLESLFPSVSFLGQSNLKSSMLLIPGCKKFSIQMYPSASNGKGSEIDIESCMYFIAVCSNKKIELESMALLDVNKEMETEKNSNNLQHIKFLSEQNQQLIKENTRIGNELSTAYRSYSFRITAPLRFLKSFFKKYIYRKRQGQMDF